MKKSLLIIIILIIALIVAGFVVVWKLRKEESSLPVTNFEECAKAGNPIMESYPRQCRQGDQTFTEDIGNELEKADLIRVDYPRPNQTIQSPLTVIGQARGYWFFEASFPVVLTNWDGLIIAQGIATAKSDWMTEEFVPFEATLTFTVDKNAYSNKGSLILKKDNPSGLPENDDALEIPVVFAVVTESVLPPPKACTQEAKLCPDGSAVGRTGPNCEFTECPIVNVVECKKDSDCSAGNLCHKNICTSPIERQCANLEDTTCPEDFECVEGCGPPVVRYPDDTPLKYFCQLKGYIRSCPICLAKNTLIDTPQCPMPVQNIKKGDLVWTINESGGRVIGVIVKTSKTPVPLNHKMVKLILEDGRTLFVSPGHPTIDNRSVKTFRSGDLYSNSKVLSSDLVLYSDEFTYDILPSGPTGFYFANNIPLASTLY